MSDLNLNVEKLRFELQATILQSLADTVHAEDGWLSDAQTANLEICSDFMKEPEFVGFSGTGSIDIRHIAEIAARECMDLLYRKGSKDDV